MNTPRLLFFCGFTIFAQLPPVGFAADGSPQTRPEAVANSQPVRTPTSLDRTNTTQTAPKPIMRSRVFQWSEMKIKPSNIGVFRDVFDDPTATLDKYSCHITTLNPGKEPHPAHRHPEEELIIVKDGTLEVVQNNVTNLVETGGMIFCASNELHGWRNTSAKPVTYFVLKVYPHDLNKTETPAQNK